MLEITLFLIGERVFLDDVKSYNTNKDCRQKTTTSFAEIKKDWKRGRGQKGKFVTTSLKCKSIVHGEGGCVKRDGGGAGNMQNT